ncbi:hypothetical protein AX16_010038 [Volvariella volvacea WC 439]|nr:hypothetical protein AX16_010038 [Volvariella volvacea WC 439]
MSIDLSLDRIRAVASALPRYTRPTVHVAGTNGKGSVTAIVASVLLQSNFSVGRFNSPHLVSIYDSILLNDQPISPELYTSIQSKIEECSGRLPVKLSNFELLTLIALQAFEEVKVDLVVLEVGMGGRLDATNIIPDEVVLVSALTAVDLDHQAFLGNTVEAIATEKAAIARAGRPFVLGPQTHTEVSGLVRRVVSESDSIFIPAIRVNSREWEPETDGPASHSISLDPSNFSHPAPQLIEAQLPCFDQPLKALFPLYGGHQLDNLSTALTAISSLISHQSPTAGAVDLAKSITVDSIRRGVQAVKWAGRLSFHHITAPRSNDPLIVLADGAHNPASSATLGAYITHILSLLPPTHNASTGDARVSGTSPSSTVSKVSLTYLLALSHSPPKTPLSTLFPLLSPPSGFDIDLGVAALRFSPPEGMPWIRHVPPSDIAEIARSLIPDTQRVEVKVFAADPTDPNNPNGPTEELVQALEWAASRNRKNQGAQSLVVLAGSLYLLADFYRLLGEGG